MELYHNFTVFPSYYFILYYAIVFCSFIYINRKFHNDLVIFIIIMLFYSGMFSYFGKFIENTYKILNLILTIYASFKFNIFKFKHSKLNLITKYFILFSTTFFISAIISQNDLLLITSQYAKIFVPFCFFFIFKHYAENTPWKINKINSFFFTLLIIQIILTLIKLVIFGTLESIVGSISYVGGGEATIIPILGFMLLWLIKRGKFKIKDWIFVLGLLLIGFVSIKRAIWFIMPIVVFLFMVYIPIKKIEISYLFFAILLSPIIFYLGIRLNPTLNKENKVWGSFDYSYAVEYASTYTFGKTDQGFHESGQGRGGATILLFNNFYKENFYDANYLFGYGLEDIFTKDYDNFDTNKFGVSSKGSVTGVFQNFIANGFIGILTFLLYVLSLIFYIKNTRVRIVIIGIFCWEYFFYSGILFKNQALTVLLIYCIIYFNVYNYKKSPELKNMNE